MVKKEYDTSLTVSGLGKIPVRFVLAMGRNSVDVFKLGTDVEKFSGLSLDDARKYSDSPDSAYIFGLCNLMNGGKDIYYYTNAGRMKGRMDKIGTEAALLERNTYELIHLAFLLLARWKHNGRGEWWNMKWPCVGYDGCDIDEEQFVEFVGKLGELIGSDYIKMYHKVIG